MQTYMSPDFKGLNFRVGGRATGEGFPKEDTKTPYVTHAGVIAKVQCLYWETEQDFQ